MDLPPTEWGWKLKKNEQLHPILTCQPPALATVRLVVNDHVVAGKQVCFVLLCGFC